MGKGGVAWNPPYHHHFVCNHHLEKIVQGFLTRHPPRKILGPVSSTKLRPECDFKTAFSPTHPESAPRAKKHVTVHQYSTSCLRVGVTLSALSPPALSLSLPKKYARFLGWNYKKILRAILKYTLEENNLEEKTLKIEAFEC